MNRNARRSVALWLLAGLWPAVADSAPAVLFDEDFESHGVGSLPADYVIGFNGLGTAEQHVAEEDGNRHLRTAGRRSWSLAMRRDFDFDLPDTVSVSWRMRVDIDQDGYTYGEAGAKYAHFGSFGIKDSDETAAGISINKYESDRRIVADCRGDGSPHEMELGEWTDFRLEADFVAGRQTLYANGTRFCQRDTSTVDLAGRRNSWGDASGIHFASGNPGSGASLTLFDDIEVRATGMPTGGREVLLSEGWEAGAIDPADWTLFGSPRPRVVAFGDRANVFDNNGDPNYDSGALSNAGLALPDGRDVRIEADVYLDFSDRAGCWAGARLGLALDADVEAVDLGRREPGTGLSLTLHGEGDRCWATPVEHRRKAWFSGGFRDGSGEWIAIPSFSASGEDYVGDWHRLAIAVDASNRVSFHIDGTLLWESDVPMDAAYRAARLLVGGRSSGSAGKAYIDDVEVAVVGTAVGETLFSDDFGSGGVGKWTIAESPQPGRLEVEGGALVMEATAGGNYSVRVVKDIVPARRFSAYRLSFDWKAVTRETPYGLDGVRLRFYDGADRLIGDLAALNSGQTGRGGDPLEHARPRELGPGRYAGIGKLAETFDWEAVTLDTAMIPGMVPENAHRLELRAWVYNDAGSGGEMHFDSFELSGGGGGHRRPGTPPDHAIPLVPRAGDAVRQGFVRVINRGGTSGEVRIDAYDDEGSHRGPLTLAVGAYETVHFNSDDLEDGNAVKGLSGATGGGTGDWRVELRTDLDIEPLSYIRTTDGFLTAMHDTAPATGARHRIAIFNPASNTNQASSLRLVNAGDEDVRVAITAHDDRGRSADTSLTVAAGKARTLTAEQLESGAGGLARGIGKGSGKWELILEASGPVTAMSLLTSPTGHLTNLSTIPARSGGAHAVPLFPAKSAEVQGFMRVINRSGRAGNARIAAFDDNGRERGPLTISLPANGVVHLNSDDLEDGEPDKGLTGRTGSGSGDWRLEITSDLDIDVLAYVRTADGFLTAMHDTAPAVGSRHEVAIFNPGANRRQVSALRLVNPTGTTATAIVRGTDDLGSRTGTVTVTIPARGARTFTAPQLESGAGVAGSLGVGTGKWRLEVESSAPVAAMSLLESPTGHLTNLSTVPVAYATAADVYRDLISGPVVQAKCVNCHVAGGDAESTRLVFVADGVADHEALNLQAFRDFVASVGDGADRVLAKIRGDESHGGGVQVAAGTEDYANMVRFLSLLGEQDSTPSTAEVRISVFGGGTVEVVGGGALDCPGPKLCVGSFAAGGSVTLRAVADPGYALDLWEGCDRVSGADCVVALDDDRLLFVDFLSAQPLTLKDNVVSFDGNRLDDVERYEPQSGLMILAADARVDDIEVGTVLVSSIVDGDRDFESHFLRRVTEVTQLAGSPAYLKTTHATLEDLIATGSLAVRETLGPDEVSGYELPPELVPVSHRASDLTTRELPDGRRTYEVTGRAAPLDGGRGPSTARTDGGGEVTGTIEFEVRAKLADGRIDVRGTIGVDVRPTFMLDAGLLRGFREFRGQVTVRPRAELTVATDVVDGKYRYPLEKLKVRFGAITAGPVVITPSLEGTLVLTVKVEAGLEPVVEMALEMTAGAHYVRGEGWSGIWDFSRHAAVRLPDSLELRATVEAGLVVDLKTKVYGLAGPKIGVGPYLGLSVFTLEPPSGTCRWDYDVYVGVRAEYGGELKVFSWGWEYTATLWDGRFTTPLGRDCPPIAGLSPRPPGRLRFPSTAADSIAVEWDPPGGTGDYGVTYEVVRSHDPGLGPDRIHRKVFAVADTRLVDGGLFQDSEYCYAVRTVAGGVMSEDGARRCERTRAVDVSPPSAPVGLAAAVESSGVVALSWNASTDDEGVNHYVIVDVSDGIGPEDVTYIGSTKGLAYNVTGLNAGTEYCFGIQSVDAAGNASHVEQTACATTLENSAAAWRYRLACEGRDYNLEGRVDLDEDFVTVVSVVGEGEDYDGTKLSYAITGPYDSGTRIFDATMDWTFEGSANTRQDKFKADLSSDDTGDIRMEQVVGSGCDGVIRFDRLDAAASAGAWPRSTGTSEGGRWRNLIIRGP